MGVGPVATGVVDHAFLHCWLAGPQRPRGEWSARGTRTRTCRRDDDTQTKLLDEEVTSRTGVGLSGPAKRSRPSESMRVKKMQRRRNGRTRKVQGGSIDFFFVEAAEALCAESRKVKRLFPEV